MCPLSNVKLRVFGALDEHNLGGCSTPGLCATVNSDDPAYFGGYVNDNYLACAAALGLARGELARLCANSISASLLPSGRKAQLLETIASFSGNEKTL